MAEPITIKPADDVHKKLYETAREALRIGREEANSKVYNWLCSVKMNDYIIVRINPDRFSTIGSYKFELSKKFFEDLKKVMNDETLS